MPNLKDLKRRIKSVKNTRQITKAMKLVAAAKMRKAQENVIASRPYHDKMFQVLHSLADRSQESSHPLMEEREEKNILVLLISSDKGLCGGFNTNLIKRTEQLVHDNEGKGIYLNVAGKKGRDYFATRNIIKNKDYPDYFRHIGYEFAAEIAADAIEIFLSGKVDRVYLVYNKFVSVATQKVIISPILPLSADRRRRKRPDLKIEDEEYKLVDYVYEPSVGEILTDIIKKYVEVEVYQALLESWASENGARMAAMDNATRNAGEMISKLTLKYNRARQAAITTEIIEIVSGADALEG
ncbi:MAG: ATP synthase F1 subunit gamma [Nitrospinota bacterium]|nr:ATP synthase F1 subunit gamma [Nitrospinota bacterium]